MSDETETGVAGPRADFPERLALDWWVGACLRLWSAAEPLPPLSKGAAGFGLGDLARLLEAHARVRGLLAMCGESPEASVDICTSGWVAVELDMIRTGCAHGCGGVLVAAVRELACAVFDRIGVDVFDVEACASQMREAAWRGTAEAQAQGLSCPVMDATALFLRDLGQLTGFKAT